MSIGANIYEARKRAGITQSQLGEKIGVSGVAIMRYEKDLREPKFEILRNIANELEVTVGYLQGYEAIDSLALHKAVKSKNANELARLVGIEPGSIVSIGAQDNPQYDEVKPNEDNKPQIITDNVTPEALKRIQELAEQGLKAENSAIGEAIKGLAQLGLGMVALNQQGIKRVLELAADLAKIPEYQRAAVDTPLKIEPENKEIRHINEDAADDDEMITLKYVARGAPAGEVQISKRVHEEIQKKLVESTDDRL